MELKLHEDMGCSRCGMAGHTARSLDCPIRAFTGEPSTVTEHPTPDLEGETFPCHALRQHSERPTHCPQLVHPRQSFICLSLKCR